MSCTVCACTRFSQHVWRKNKCNECFHALQLHQGVTVDDTGRIFIDGVLAPPPGTATITPASSSMNTANAAQVVSPIQNRQQAFESFQAHAPHASAHPATPAAAKPAEPEKVQMVTTAPAATGRKFAAPGSKGPAASPVAAASPVSSADSSSLSVPAALDTSAAALLATPTKGGSKPGSKPGSRRGSLKGGLGTIPGMVAEAQPYAVKALYSHTGNIPEQLTFKRGEVLEIDGHMEGWLNAIVLEQPERRGWIPSNYVERLPEGSVQLLSARKSRRSSAMISTPAASNTTATASPASSSASAVTSSPPHSNGVVISAANLVHSPGPAINNMSSDRHVYDATTASTNGNAPSVLLEALYDFAAEFPEQQLTFQKGDVFVLMNQEDPDWWDVKNSETGAVGAVPALYMRELKNVDSNAAKELIATEPITAAAAANAAVNVVEIPIMTAPEQVKAAPKEESAPSRRTSVITPAAAAAPAPTPAAPAMPADATHRAAYPFTATAAGQLSYAKDDYLTLLSEDHVGWHRFKHHASGQQGLVATNYIRPITSEERAAASASVDNSAAEVEAAAAAAEAARLAREEEDRRQRMEDEARKRAEEARLKAEADRLEAEEAEVARQRAEEAAKAAAARLEAERAAAEAEAERIRKQQEAEAMAAAQKAREEAEALARMKAAEAEAAERARAEAEAKAAAEAEAAARAAAEQAAALAAQQKAEADAAAAAAAAASTPSASTYPSHSSLYAFAATEPGQLSLEFNEAVDVHEKGDHGWWTVKNAKGEVGMVPANYLNQEPNAPVAQPAAAAAPAASPAARGSIISTDAAVNPTHIGSVGFSPKANERRQSNVINELAGMGTSAENQFTVLPRQSSRGSVVGSSSLPPVSEAAATVEQGTANYDFEATHPGQLAFKKGDVVTVLAKPSAGWFFAKAANGEEGNCPENYFTFATVQAATSQPQPAAAAVPATSPSSGSDSALGRIGAGAAFLASLPPATSGGRRGTVMDGASAGARAGPPPVPAHLAEHMKRHSVISAGSSQGQTVLANAKPLSPLSPSKGAPPPLTREMSEKVRRDSKVIATQDPTSPTSLWQQAQEAEKKAKGTSSSSSNLAPHDATHRAAYTFSGSEVGQLSYTKGDCFTLLSKDHEGWWRFRHVASGLQGLVASNYVKELTDAEKQPAPAAVDNSAAEAAAALAAESARVEAARVEAERQEAARAEAAAAEAARQEAERQAAEAEALRVRQQKEAEAAAAAAAKAQAEAEAAARAKAEAEADAAAKAKAAAEEEAARVAAAHAAAQAQAQAAAAATAAAAAAAAAATSSSASAHPYHSSLYAFTATEPGQLTLALSEAVEVHEKGDHGWWTVKNAKGEVGMVPANYLNQGALAQVPAEFAKAAPPAAVVPAAEPVAAAAAAAPAPSPLVVEEGYWAVCLYDYAAQGADQLSVVRGQVVSVTGTASPDWVTAMNNEGAAGILPVSYLARVLSKARTLYAFAADAEKNFLGFEADQIILVTEKNQETSWGTGWVQGTTNSGLFPLNYVQDA